MDNSIELSRLGGKIMGFLNREGEVLFIKQITSSKSYDALPALYKSWIDNPLSIPEKYLNEPAKKYVKRQRKQT